MGNCQAICASIDDNSELRVVFLENPQSGAIIGLTAEAKKIIWNNLHASSFSKQIPNTFAFDNDKSTGFIYLPNHFLYQGPIRQNNPQGVGRLALISDKILLDGNFKKGQLEGKAQFNLKQINIKGTWVGGCPLWLQSTIGNQSYRIRFHSQDLKSGEIRFSNGSVYSGEISYDVDELAHLAHGQGKLTYSCGSTVQGSFQSGWLEGTGTFRSHNLLHSYKGYFHQGEFSGKGQFDYGDGSVLSIEWEKNKPKGRGEIIVNGKSIPVFFRNGVMIKEMSSIFHE